MLADLGTAVTTRARRSDPSARPATWKILIGVAAALAVSVLSTFSRARSGPDFHSQRAAMIAGIHDRIRRSALVADDPYLAQTLSAMSEVPRERFVPAKLAGRAYGLTSLPIGHGQTISDPYVVAVMTAAAHIPEHANVLDVGTGSGYQAAVLARLASRVSSIEIVRPLAEQAANRLAELGYVNVEVRTGDGYAGWVEHAPFDAIIVAAGAAEVPQPLLDQLKPGARLVMPIGPSWAQEQIMVLAKSADGVVTRCSMGWTMFVPLTGRGERAPGSRGLFDTSVPPCYERPVVSP